MSFQRTSEIAGGGLAYNPGSTYFPLTDYMALSGFTHAANVHTVFGIIQCDPFVAATAAYMSVFRSQHSNNTIASLNVLPSDAGTAPNGGQMFGRDSGGGVMFDIRCSDILVDGEKHWFFFAYNAATADYIFIVDGKNATIASETANTGTQASGASAAFGLGSNDLGTATVDYIGEVSFFGYDDSYRENWYDFFEADGTPKQIDVDTWAEWGAQPLVFNPHADLRNNLGSLGNFTANGTGMRAGDMMNNAIPYRGLGTIGDITAAMLPEDRVGWANGQRFVGTQNTGQGLLLAADFRGSSLALFPYDGSSFAFLHPDITAGSMGGGLERAPEGAKMYVPGSGFYCNGVPAFTNGRHIITTVDLDYNSYSNGLMDINTNFTDGSNLYFSRIIWNVGGYWQLQIYSVIGGSTVQRASVNINTSIEDAYAVITCSDFGDQLLLSAHIYEKGSSNIVDAQHASYYQSSRTGKTPSNFRIDFEQSQAIRLQSVMALNF